MTRPLDPISLRPVFAAVAGRAWEIDLDAGYTSRGLDRAKGGDVAWWLVEAEWANLLWHSYVVLLTHLRRLEGKDAPEFYKKGATHEFWVGHLDPIVKREEVIVTGVIPALPALTFAGQIGIYTDAGAAAFVFRRVVRAICEGKISPDRRHQAAWVERFGGEMIRRAG